MKLIKIINGTYGFRPQPNVVELKDAGDAPFEVDDKEAARLVDLGVAKIAYGEDSESLREAMDGMVDQLGDQPAPPEEDLEDEPKDPDAEPEHAGDEPEDEPKDDGTEEPAPKFDPEELEKLTNPQLRELAEALGIHLSGRPKKEEFIDAILKAAAEDDELPDLGAADPEV